MKKSLIALFVLILLFSAVAVGAYAATQLTLIVNGSKVTSAEAKLIDGVTYVPLRAVSEILGATVGWDGDTSTVTVTGKDYIADDANQAYDVTISFPASKYPETAAHIKAAIAAGKSPVCTIDRAGADANRDGSLKGIPTKDGYDRDEWPMAMCEEGGTGAHVEYVLSSDNRGAGSWVGNQLESYTDGTRVLFILDESVDGSSSAATTPQPDTEANLNYKSCAEVKAAGKAPIRRGDPGYSTKLDRDGDGIACEAA